MMPTTKGLYPGHEGVGPPRRSDRRSVSRGGATPGEQDEFEATLRAERREAEARADAAERRRDSAPRSRGPRAAPRGPKKLPGVRGPSRILGKGRRWALRNPRRTLLLEGLAVMVIVTAARAAKGEAPQAWDYVAPFVVYLVLSFAVEFKPLAPVTIGLGGLILLSVFLGYSADLVLALRGVEFGPGEGPTTLGAQGVSGFGPGGQSGQGSGGGGGGSW